MTTEMPMGDRARPPAWRVWLWGTAAALLALPWVAMRFTQEVNWTAGDFAVFGVMLLVACGAFELGARMARSHGYRVAAAIAIGASFLMTWANLAVGIIGNENHPANQWFFGVIGVAIFGALLARGRPRGMMWAMLATAAAQLAVAIAAQWLVGAWIWIFTGVFVALWCTAAWLFARAARHGASRTA